jgi:uncharacterized membrane protein YeaQ/YmgE (transglycosylase-associated protein family)
MGWIVVLLCVVLVVFLTRQSVDRETTGNLKFLSNTIAGLVGLIVINIFSSYIFH